MLTEKDIQNIARLSNLKLNDEQTARMQRDLEHMIDFARVVCDADIYEDNNRFVQEDCFLREDREEGSYPVQEMLCNAPVHKDGYILLRKSE